MDIEETDEENIKSDLSKTVVHTNHAAQALKPRPISSNRSKNYEDLRIFLFKTVHEGDMEALLPCLEDVKAKIPLSHCAMRNPKNNENILNYAPSKTLFEKANLLIENSDESLLQNAFRMGSSTKTAFK